MITYNQDANITNTPKATESGGSSVAKAIKTKSVPPTWKPLVNNLTDALNGMEQGQILTLQKSSPEEWIQFAPQGKSIRIECKSNAYREAHQQLTLDQVATLAEIGWSAPTGSPEQSKPANDVDGSPNFYRDLPLPLKPKALNVLVVRTFTEVFSATHPATLAYEAYDGDGDSLFLPELGLPPAITCTDASLNPKLPEQLLAAIAQLTGVGGWSYDGQGDIGPIGFGSIKAYARVVEKSPYVRFYVPAVDDVETTPHLLTKLNELNCVHGHMHMCLLNNCITAVSDVLVSPFNVNYVAAALGNFLQIADEFSIELIEEFGTSKAPTQQPLWH